MKIAYASDNEQQREQFRTYLTAYFARHPAECEICIFDTPEKLLESVSDTLYDLVFFNMTYGEKSGVAYVYKMREELKTALLEMSETAGMCWPGKLIRRVSRIISLRRTGAKRISIFRQITTKQLCRAGCGMPHSEY